MQFNPLGFPTENYWLFPASVNNLQQKPVGKLKRRTTYNRRTKPPYSYTELITKVIRASPEKLVTLRQIVESLKIQYPCFRGEYQGWRNSVRHNLSANECFTKVLRDHNKPNAKDNFWTINEDCHHCQLLRESRNSKDKGHSKIHRSKGRNDGEVLVSQESATRPPELQYLDSPKELVIDLGQHTTVDLNNNGMATRQNHLRDVREPLGFTNHAELKHLSPTNNNSTPTENNNETALRKNAIDTMDQESSGWCKMTIGDINELNFVRPNPETTRYHPQQPQAWDNLPPPYRRPYVEPGQYVYPYPVARSQTYPDAMYQNRFCPPTYSMANPAFVNIAAMSQPKERLQHLQIQHHQPFTPLGDGYSDGPNSHTPSPVTEGSWGLPEQPLINAEYHQI